MSVTRQDLLWLSVGMLALGGLIGFGVAQTTQLAYDDYILNDSAQPNHVLKAGDYGYFVITKYVPPCDTYACLGNYTILNRSVP